MAQTDYKKLGSYLKNESKLLQSIFHKAQVIARLQTAILPLLPMSIRPHCQVGNYQQNRLVILVTNAAIATQLRLTSQDYLQQFKAISMLKAIQQIQIKVRPNIQTLAAPAANIHKVQPLSKAAAASVKRIAACIEDDKLRDVLQRIAQHCK